MLLITYSCNLNCTYCYETKAADKVMNLENAKRYILTIVEEIGSEYDEFEIQFMGGEPLTRFQFIKALSIWLWQQTFKIPLVQIFAATNGTLLNGEMKEWFFENKDRICLGLSFDGDIIMQNTNRSNSYKDVDLNYFAKTWPNQSVKMTISPSTIPFLYDGVTFLHKMGFNDIASDLAMGTKISWERMHLEIFNNELAKLTEFYLQNSDLKRVSLLDVDIFAVMLTNESAKKCSCGEDLVCVDYDGGRYACHLFSPISQSRASARLSQKIDFKRHADFIPQVCQDCILLPVCTICYGMNYLLSGDITQQDSFVCQAFKIQFYNCCNLYLKISDKTKNTSDKALIERLLAEIN